jgi:metal-responsive CopG/Arc/MetJ family transcriptional regulator
MPTKTTTRTHIVIPSDLVHEIDELVGRRQRSAFLVQVASQEVKRLRQLKALERAAGSWKDEDHPELKDGAAEWVHELRNLSNKRLERIHRNSA